MEHTKISKISQFPDPTVANVSTFELGGCQYFLPDSAVADVSTFDEIKQSTFIP